MDTNILLESGTNELEILKFSIQGKYYGINVAKVKEIIRSIPVTPVPNSHDCIMGLIMPRDQVISIIDLPKYLGFHESLDDGFFIISGFNKLCVGFMADRVEGIIRMPWTAVKPPSELTPKENAFTTGIVSDGGNLVIMLDFEKIVAEISPGTGITEKSLNSIRSHGRKDLHILMAEDSGMLNKVIKDGLNHAGYINVESYMNGQEAWEKLCEYRDNGTLSEHAECVLTDIEMPQMDGHRLTKLIKTDEKLKNIKVIIFSSLINDDIVRKGESVGADAQLAKPQLAELIEKLDSMFNIASEK